MKKNDIQVRCFLITEDGTTKPWAELKPEEIKKFRAAASERLSRTMSDYYTQHPEQYAAV